MPAGKWHRDQNNRRGRQQKEVGARAERLEMPDVAGIDGTVNGIAEGATAIGDGVRHTQSGNTRSYAVWVVVGAIAIIAVIFFWPFGGKTVIGMVR